mmetsp:Transcript_23397/g.92951  ORF Transcript_23397/g.92951 Transcript_23397/m.92951 type:complete len:200 (-) Transcript_23397:1181-1780(-)
MRIFPRCLLWRTNPLVATLSKVSTVAFPKSTGITYAHLTPELNKFRWKDFCLSVLLEILSKESIERPKYASRSIDPRGVSFSRTVSEAEACARPSLLGGVARTKTECSELPLIENSLSSSLNMFLSGSDPVIFRLIILERALGFLKYSILPLVQSCTPPKTTAFGRISNSTDCADCGIEFFTGESFRVSSTEASLLLVA